MGKGDKKTRRGKIILGTYGVRRKRKKNAGIIAKSSGFAEDKEMRESKSRRGRKEAKEILPIKEGAEVKDVKKVEEVLESLDNEEVIEVQPPNESEEIKKTEETGTIKVKKSTRSVKPKKEGSKNIATGKKTESKTTKKA